MACIDVPIPDQQSECPPDVSFFSIGYWRLFPVDPPQESEKGQKCLAIAYDVAGNERMRGDVWAKMDESGHWILTPILPAFPV